MKAMILAAGIGSRMKDLTKERPKCLMKVGGTTMLENIAKRLISAGVTEIVINMHHFPDLIQNYIQLKDCFGIPVHLSFEEELLDTAGGIKNVEEILRGDEPFIVHNCDIYTQYSLEKLISEHKSNGAVATLAVADIENDRPLLFNQEGNLLGWRNKSTKEEVLLNEKDEVVEKLFCGFYIASPEIFDFMPEQGTPHSVITTFLDVVRDNKKVIAADIGESFWIDIGTPEKFEELKSVLT